MNEHTVVLNQVSAVAAEVEVRQSSDFNMPYTQRYVPLETKQPYPNLPAVISNPTYKLGQVFKSSNETDKSKSSKETEL